MTQNTVVLMGCGDVGPMLEPIEPYSALVRPTLGGSDIRFAQVERLYSNRGALQVHSGGSHSRVKPHLASVFSDCGFDVLSMASNHGMDWGEEAMLDTIALLRKQGVQTVGAGRDINEARQPAIIERNGVRVAILAYCSVLNEGYSAGPSKAGIAPLRVHTYYEPTEYQPGVPPKVVTVPYAEDMAAMVEDIVKAKKAANIVILSLHWGIHFIPRMIADYQPIAAKAAFAAGADLILGHHAHIPKAVGVYSGKVCFYSLSNFIISAPAHTPDKAAAFTKRFGLTLDPDYPHLPYGADAKRSLIAKVMLTREGVRKVSFLPVLIDKQLRPEILRYEDARFTDAVAYMDWASEGFDHKFTIEDGEVVITGT